MRRLVRKQSCGPKFVPLTLQCSNPAVQVRLARAVTVEVPSEIVEAKKHPRLRVVGRQLTSEEVDLLVAARAMGATSAAFGGRVRSSPVDGGSAPSPPGVAPIPGPALSEAEASRAQRSSSLMPCQATLAMSFDGASVMPRSARSMNVMGDGATHFAG